MSLENVPMASPIEKLAGLAGIRVVGSMRGEQRRVRGREHGLRVGEASQCDERSAQHQAGFRGAEMILTQPLHA